jgi:two-component system, cell cycle sensor histidine kinase and response regulator CckA
MDDTSGRLTSTQVVILVAEDELVVRNLVRTVLTNAGYTVLDAVDGENALDISRRYSGWIHMLLTDVKMPKMNGLELSAHITRERPGIKILIMSGKTSGEPLILGQSVQFLRKPFLPETLRKRMSAMLSISACSSSPE